MTNSFMGLCGPTGLAALMMLWATTGLSATNKADYARELRAQLIEKVMPYWHETAIDKQYGGYLLADDAMRGRRDRLVCGRCGSDGG